MADVKWVKLTTDMFDNRKIKHLRKLPEGNNIVLIWVMLLTLAGRCNSNGMIFLTENIPYTPKMLADELDFEENTVKLALNALEGLGMIVTDGNYFFISGWQEHQNIEGMDKIREQNRIRKRNQRERQKLALETRSHVTSRDSHEAEEDKEEEKETDKDIKRIDYQHIADMYNEICISFPSVKSLSDARKKAIKARMNTYSVDDFKTCFEKAESSDFLKGGNDRNWTANFDWLIKDANMAKVLDGNYDNKQRASGRKEVVPHWMKKDMNNFERRQYDMDDLEGKLLETKKPKLSEDYKRRVEVLKNDLGVS